MSKTYTIHALVNGRDRFKSVEADNKQVAIEKSGFSAEKIVSVKKHGALLSIEPAPPSITTQIMVLSSLSSLMLSKRLEECLHEIIMQNGSLKKYSDKLRGVTTVSEALEKMNFKPETVAIVRAGEESGRTSDVLRTLAKFEIKMDQVRRSMSGGVLEGMIYGFLGLLMTVMMPWVYSDVIRTFMAVNELHIETNSMTDALMFFNWLYFEQWPFIVGVVIVIVAFKKKIWKQVKNYPFFKLFNHYNNLKRSLNFLVGFVPMFQNGLTTPEAVALLSQKKKGADLDAYEGLKNAIQKGHSLSTAFRNANDGWAPELVTGMAGFEEGTRETQNEILENLQDMLISIITMKGGLIGRVLTGIGYSLILFSFILAIVGGMWPLQAVEVQG